MRPSGRARHGIFISYARSDGEAAARALHGRLAAALPDVPAWLDRQELEGGIGWWNQIERALDDIEFLVILATPAALRSENTRREWSSARQRGVCVYPVRSGSGEVLDFSSLPGWMSRAHFYDLDREWPKFVAHLQRGCQAVRVPFMAPALPQNFVARERELAALMDWLLAPSPSRLPVAIATAVSGAGGFGKTTLAAAVCHDERIVEAYEDGILWVTLGQTPNLLNELVKLYAALTGERPGFVDMEDAARELALKLADKSCLIVVDDAWNLAHARRFLCGGPNCAVLVTTRVFEVASQGRALEVDRMTPTEAVALLRASANAAVPDQARGAELVARLGHWPLAIKLAGSAMRQLTDRGESADNALEYVFRKLEKHGPTAFDRLGASARDEAVGLTIDVSLGLLSAVERQSACELSIFREDEAVALGAAAQLWGCDPFDAGDFARRLDDLALVDLDQPRGTLRLHDTLRAYLAARLGDPAPAHQRLVDAWGERPAAADAFAWRGIAWHMVSAGRQARLRELLAEPAWLEAKLAATDIHALVDDFDAAGAPGVLEAVRDALRLSAPALAGQPKELRTQLHGRLLARTDDDGAALRRALAQAASEPWLRLLHPSLDAPGGMLRMTLVGSRRGVRGLASDAAHRLLLSGSVDGLLNAWDWDSGRRQPLHGAPHLAVLAVALSADGRRALSCGADGMLELWDVERRERVSHFQVGDDSGVRSAAMSADASRAITFGREPELLVWDLDARARSHVLRGHAEPVTAVAMTPDGRRAVSGSDDGRLIVWDLAAGLPERRLGTHGGPVNAVAISPDGAFALSGAVDCSARLWDLATGACLLTLRGHECGVTAVALAHAAGRALTGASDGSVAVWDLRGGELLARPSGHSDAVTAAQLSGDGQRAATAAADGTVKLWQCERLGAVVPSALHQGAVEVVEFSPDGRLCASGGADGRVAIVDVASGQILRGIAAHSTPIRSLAFSDDGSCVLSAGIDGRYWLWIVATGESTWIPISHDVPVDDSAFSPVSRYLATCCQDKTLRLWDIPSGAALARFSTRRMFDHLIEPSPLRARMPQTADSLDVYLGGEPRFELGGARIERGGRHVAVTAVRRDVASFSARAEERRSVETQQAFLLVLEVAAEGVRTIALPQREMPTAFDVDAGGTRLLYADTAHDVVLLELENAGGPRHLKGHGEKVNAVAFDAAGVFGYSCGRDRSLRAWRLADGAQVASFTADAALRSLAVSPDGVTLAVGDMAGRMHLLRLADAGAAR